MRAEIWKDISGYEGLYEVSNLGRVRSLPRPRTTGKILKPNTVRGYKQVSLSVGGKMRYYKVHRLVAQAFLENPDNLPQVNHKDENKLNNAVDNLEWCDCKYNINYGTAIARRSVKAGITKSKKVAQYSRSGVLLGVWDSALKAARELGINQGGISNCCLHKNKTAYGFVWEYV